MGHPCHPRSLTPDPWTAFVLLEHVHHARSALAPRDVRERRADDDRRSTDGDAGNRPGRNAVAEGRAVGIAGQLCDFLPGLSAEDALEHVDGAACRDRYRATVSGEGRSEAGCAVTRSERRRVNPVNATRVSFEHSHRAVPTDDCGIPSERGGAERRRTVAPRQRADAREQFVLLRPAAGRAGRHHQHGKRESQQDRPRR